MKNKPQFPVNYKLVTLCSFSTWETVSWPSYTIRYRYLWKLWNCNRYNKEIVEFKIAVFFYSLFPFLYFRVVAQRSKALGLGPRYHRRFESCLPYEGKYLKHTEVRWNIDTRKLNVWARFKSFHEFLRIVFIFYLRIWRDS